jgi:hypothetical protein
MKKELNYFASKSWNFAQLSINKKLTQGANEIYALRRAPNFNEIQPPRSQFST